MRDEFQQAAGDGAGGAQAVRRRAARRDRARHRSARLRDGRGAVQPAAAPRARPGGRRAGALALRPAPSGGEPRPRWPSWRGAWAGGRGGDSWRQLREDSPEPATLLDVYRRSWSGRMHSSRHGSRQHTRAIRWTWCRPRLHAGAGAVRGVRAAADLPAHQTGRFYVTPPDPSLPPETLARQLRGHCRHAIPAWWRTRRIPATTCSWSPRRGSAPRSGATSGRRSWSRDGRSTASSSWTSPATMPTTRPGCSSWSTCSGARSGSCSTSGCTPAG